MSPKKLLKNGFFMKWPSFFVLFLNLDSFFKPFRKCFAKKLQTLESNEIQKMEVKPLNYDTCKPNLVPFVCNQAWFNFQARGVRSLCQKEGIVFQAYASLGSGQLGLCQNPVVMEVSSKVGMSPGQVLLRWAVQVNFHPIYNVFNKFCWNGEVLINLRFFEKATKFEEISILVLTLIKVVFVQKFDAAPKIFQITILKRKSKFPTHISKQLIQIFCSG